MDEIGEILAEDAGSVRPDLTRVASVLHNHDTHIDPDVLFSQDARVDGDLNLLTAILSHLFGVYQSGRTA